MKRFNKTVTTEEQRALCEEQTAIKDTLKEVNNTLRENWKTYNDMEGKYSNGTKCDPYAGQGYRGWYYTYPDKETEIKEETEREEYYKNNIEPFEETQYELQKKLQVVEEKLCVAMWGFTREEYHLRRALEIVENELAEKMKEVEDLRNELKKIQERGE